MIAKNHIQVFEYQLLQCGDVFKRKHLAALSKLNALNNDCYFDLRYNGVKFKNFVGVLQVENLTIEILPKVDTQEDNTALWQGVLIDMLKTTKKLNISKVGKANVSKQNLHLLDIYFQWFLDEVEVLIHQGLIKQYYRKTGNVKALKGKLEFAGHLRKNLVHKERFYTTHQVYAKDHLIHQVLSFALSIIEKFSKGTYVYSRCKSVQLNFPEVSKINIDSRSFTRIKLNRKSAPYKTALEIARFIILQYAPNIKHGQENMIALLFDMNSLWEEFIYISLKRHLPGKYTIHAQNTKKFWKPNSGYNSNMRPDIVINRGMQDCIVLDTKWKNIKKSSPVPNDLRQLYVYHDYYSAQKVALIYPGNSSSLSSGFYYEKYGEKLSNKECGLISIQVNRNIKKWQFDIAQEIDNWIKNS
ncbi:McrC family protein [Zunongwangia atlantica]|uniref:5-methylcytosine restriction component McrC n=1 Tax=Zunongwangia atlantica 22II14-10F7 TaxID=1185767 RepID=A0A1Y1T095_9FLAO|nr:hypothetical protein [Zunongwangia atlantica]ORL44064.1 5-methylcytosine restriction component McrC [Zunongwangia atlantica 22II14-10F7]